MAWLFAFMLPLILLDAPGARSDAAVADEAAERVSTLMVERLALMKQVAAYKFIEGVAIEDREREAVVLRAAEQRALELGLDAARARAFFAAQIEAAKAVQACWHERWSRKPEIAPFEAPDLSTEIRPRLIQLGEALAEAIAAKLEARRGFDASARDSFLAVVELECLSEEEAERLHGALVQLRLADP